MTTEKLPEENKNVGGVSPSDHDSLIELYARFGVELKSEQFGGHYLVFFPCSSVAEFNEHGKFISQTLIG